MAPPELPGGVGLVHTPPRAPSVAQKPREAQRRLLEGSQRTRALLFQNPTHFSEIPNPKSHPLIETGALLAPAPFVPTALENLERLCRSLCAEAPPPSPCAAMVAFACAVANGGGGGGGGIAPEVCTTRLQ